MDSSRWCPYGFPVVSQCVPGGVPVVTPVPSGVVLFVRLPGILPYLAASRSVSPEKWPEGFLENFQECLPEGFPGACLEGLSAGLPECFQKLLSAGLPESGGCRFPANFLEGQCHRETFARFHLSLGMSGWKDLVYLSERLRRATSKVMISLREARGLRNHRNN